MKRDPLRALAVGAAVVTVALTGAAFWLSYEHLHDVAAGNGLTGARAWAWPGTVDLFIVAGELLILRAALRGRFDWFAYLLAGVGSLGSIALNVAGVGAHAQPMEYVVAAVPPTAALVAFGALMRQVHEALARVAEPAPVPAEEEAAPAPVPAEPQAVPVAPEAEPAVPVEGLDVIQPPPILPVLGPVMPLPVPRPEPAGTGGGTGAEQVGSGVKGDIPPHPVPVGGTGGTSTGTETGTGGTGRVPSGTHRINPVVGPAQSVTGDDSPSVFEQRVTLVRNWLAEDPALTGTAIGERLGTTDGYGRRVRRAALNGHPS